MRKESQGAIKQSFSKPEYERELLLFDAHLKYTGYTASLQPQGFTNVYTYYLRIDYGSLAAYNPALRNIFEHIHHSLETNTKNCQKVRSAVGSVQVTAGDFNLKKAP
jgi:gamma-glutamylcysteine synthetase